MCWTICLGWLQTTILLISVSWIARITGVSTGAWQMFSPHTHKSEVMDMQISSSVALSSRCTHTTSTHWGIHLKNIQFLFVNSNCSKTEEKERKALPFFSVHLTFTIKTAAVVVCASTSHNIRPYLDNASALLLPSLYKCRGQAQRWDICLRSPVGVRQSKGGGSGPVYCSSPVSLSIPTTS
jgi:hypothetical protein